MTPFQDVYDKFLHLVKDFELARMDDVDLEDELFNFMDSAIALHFTNCRQDLTDMDIANKQFNVELTRQEVNILANGMVLAWLEPKIKTDRVIEMQVGSRDFRATSSQAHLIALLKLEDETIKKLNRYKTSYEYSGFEGF